MSTFLFYFYRITYYISHHWFIAVSESVLCLYDIIVLRYDLMNLEIRQHFKRPNVYFSMSHTNMDKVPPKTFKFEFLDSR